ncbi:MAG: FAD:protein FMN transferase [Desulfatitalea sp.]
MKKKYDAVIAALVLMSLILPVACGGDKEYQLAGKTMGTTYHIKVKAGRSIDMVKVQAKVDAGLEQVNQSMSTFRPESEISRFNALNAVDTPFAVSAGFLRVMQTAQEIHRLTEGAWDGTVDPLVNLWGFGKEGTLRQVPSAEAVAQAKERVGFDRIGIAADGHLTKRHLDVTVDLASIAKGYGVDQVAAVLDELGFEDFLVEIGGEVYASGVRPDGTPWRVGINQPQADAPFDAVYKVVRLRDGAMATSGDYRNFYQIEGRTYSHIIDPRTGYPIQNNVVSATVVAGDCTLADGLATALMVMGPEKGIALLDRLDGVEGLIVVRQADGTFQNFFSKGMEAISAE